jgi:hypothetical protein
MSSPAAGRRRRNADIVGFTIRRRRRVPHDRLSVPHRASRSLRQRFQEVYGKTLGALFDSGELAPVRRRSTAEVGDIASSTAHRAIAEAVAAGRKARSTVQAHPTTWNDA